MKNLAMKRKLDAGQCLDLRKIGEPLSESGERTAWFLITSMTGEEVDSCALDFCDVENEAWCWSIGVCEVETYFLNGRELKRGAVVASLASDMYQRAGWRCVWLR